MINIGLCLKINIYITLILSVFILTKKYSANNFMILAGLLVISIFSLIAIGICADENLARADIISSLSVLFELFILVSYFIKLLSVTKKGI